MAKTFLDVSLQEATLPLAERRRGPRSAKESARRIQPEAWKTAPGPE